MKTNWDKRFMGLAHYIAGWSKDRSTGTCAVIVDNDKRIVSIGYNGFPSGLDDTIDAWHERPAKYRYTEHAERNAIFNAARIGVSTKGCTLYIMWYPCAPCARAILQAGIKRLVCYKPDMDSEWGDDFVAAKDMLNRAEEKGLITIEYLEPNSQNP